MAAIAGKQMEGKTLYYTINAVAGLAIFLCVYRNSFGWKDIERDCQH